jgi:hypothetical protein
VTRLPKAALILPNTTSSMRHGSIESLFCSLLKTVNPIFVKVNVSPIAETTPRHGPPSPFGVAA